MDNETNEVLPPNVVEEKEGDEQNGSGTGATGSVENNELKNDDEKKRPANNSAEVHGDNPFTFQGNPIFNNPTFNFGERRSTERENESDDTKHKKESDEKPRDDRTRGESETKEQKQPPQKNLLDLTSEFVTPRGNRPHFNDAEMDQQLKDLENNNLIFITCADEQMAKAAACLLAEKLPLRDPAQKRLLDLGRANKKDSKLEITPLLQDVPRKFEVAVIV